MGAGGTGTRRLTAFRAVIRPRRPTQFAGSPRDAEATAMLGHRHRVSSVQPMPARGAPDEVAGVVHLLFGYSVPTVGHVRLRQEPRPAAAFSLTSSGAR